MKPHCTTSRGPLSSRSVEIVAIERNVFPYAPSRLRSQAVLRVDGRSYVVPIRPTLMHSFEPFRRHVAAVLGIVVANHWGSDDRFWMAVVNAAGRAAR